MFDLNDKVVSPLPEGMGENEWRDFLNHGESAIERTFGLPVGLIEIGEGKITFLGCYRNGYYDWEREDCSLSLVGDHLELHHGGRPDVILRGPSHHQALRALGLPEPRSATAVHGKEDSRAFPTPHPRGLGVHLDA